MSVRPPGSSDQPTPPAVRHAILLFERGSAAHSDGLTTVDPLRPVGGVPVLHRLILLLQRKGFDHITIVADALSSELLESVRREHRITADIRAVQSSDASLQQPADARLVVTGAIVCSAALIDRLQALAREEPFRLIIVRHLQELARGCHIMVVPPGMRWSPPWSGDGVTFRAVEKLHDERLIRLLPSDDRSAEWYRPIRCKEDVVNVERLLLRTRKDTHEGFIDRYVNRPISERFTRLFLQIGWSPNAVTTLALALGFLAAAVLAQGSYMAGVMGGLLFQLAAIIDCCDGELARLTYRESRLGQHLDFYGDNAVHLALFGGLAWGGYAQVSSFGAMVLATSAVAGIGMAVLAVVWLKSCLAARHGATPPGALSLFVLNSVASRDFSIVLLAFALADRLGWFLWSAAVAIHAFWIAALCVGRLEAKAKLTLRPMHARISRIVRAPLVGAAGTVREK